MARTATPTHSPGKLPCSLTTSFSAPVSWCIRSGCCRLHTASRSECGAEGGAWGRDVQAELWAGKALRGQGTGPGLRVQGALGRTVWTPWGVAPGSQSLVEEGTDAEGTAGRCPGVTRSLVLSAYTVGLGLHSLQAEQEPGSHMLEATLSIQHPEYNSPFLANDLMLIKLKRPVVQSPNIRTVRVASQVPVAGESCLVSGWGLQRNGEPWGNGCGCVPPP